MPSLTTSQILLQIGIRMTVLVMIVGIIYFYAFKPVPLAAPRSYVGDPRTSCVYPVDAITGVTIQYANDTGQPPSWDEIANESQVKGTGYQTCK